jgi:L-ascorbate metabolism protein UlaG (beta-lactamase superfamily)
MATIQLIRNASLKINYTGTTFLVDPMLGEKGSFESYGGIQNNPIKELPISIDEVLEGVEVVLVTHLHKDHFDDKAREVLHQSIPIFCQPGDQEQIETSNFTQVNEIETSITLQDIQITRTTGNHGRGPIEKLMGNVSGFVFQSEDEPTIYIVGDCIFNERVKNAIDSYQPEIIITNSGGAFIPGYEEHLILLDEVETMELTSYAKDSKIIALHLEALDHCTVSRASLKRSLLQSDIDSERFFIPLDGEVVTL